MTSITYDNPSREVSCASTGGPTTSVIWNRSGPTYKNSKRIVNTIQAQYINTLTVPSSEELTDATESFTCLVSNSRGNSSRTLSLYQGENMLLVTLHYVVFMSLSLFCHVPAGNNI